MCLTMADGSHQQRWKASAETVNGIVINLPLSVDGTPMTSAAVCYTELSENDG